MTRLAVTTPLEERMRKTQAGQVTWAEPALRLKCESCHHLVNLKMKKGEILGQCDKVYVMQNKWSAHFNVNATACPEHKGRI